MTIDEEAKKAIEEMSARLGVNMNSWQLSPSDRVKFEECVRWMLERESAVLMPLMSKMMDEKIAAAMGKDSTLSVLDAEDGEIVPATPAPEKRKAKRPSATEPKVATGGIP